VQRRCRRDRRPLAIEVCASSGVRGVDSTPPASSSKMSKASAKYNGMENVSGCDPAVNRAPKEYPARITRRAEAAARAIARRSLRRLVNFDQILESASGILPGMGRRGSTAKDRPAHLEGRPMAYPKSLRLLIRGRLESGALTARVSKGPRAVPATEKAVSLATESSRSPSSPWRASTSMARSFSSTWSASPSGI
jgi:hypothetical protein